jgi:Ribosomal protein L7Ae/L30e/S12e/Gadd45 family.
MQVNNGRFSWVVNRKSLCKAVVTVLRKAQTEKRLTCGLTPAIKLLEADPERVLFCIMPQGSQGNAALHIQCVLLQAFCNENDIHIIQVHISVSV